VTGGERQQLVLDDRLDPTAGALGGRWGHARILATKVVTPIGRHDHDGLSSAEMHDQSALSTLLLTETRK